MSSPHPDIANPGSERTALLLGAEALGRLAEAHVLVAGVGGVGAYAVEMLARTGVGRITLVDGDDVAPSNLNRQLPALLSTIGLPKADVMARRIADINPSLRVASLREFITPESAAGYLESRPDFVIDAIDSISPKVALLAACVRAGVPVVSSMGAGGRLDPTLITYADISKTYHDGLAREVRRRLRRDEGITSGVMTVFSTEQPSRSAVMMTDEIAYKASSFGTVAWVPAQFGMMLAAYAIRKLTGK